MRNRILKIIGGAIQAGIDKGQFALDKTPELELEMTKDPSFGDYASNAAMMLASRLKMKPRKIAEDIAANIQDPEGMIEKIEIAGPGELA